MNEIFFLIAAVLLTVGEATMPKPRSYIPAKVTLVAIVLLVVIAFFQWRYPEYIPENYLVWIMLVIIVIPIVVYLFILRKESLNNVLSKLDKENRHIVENIIGILQQIYFNSKAMAEKLSSNVTDDKIESINVETNRVLGLKLLNFAMAYHGKRTIKVIIKASFYALRDISVLIVLMLSPRFIKETMMFYTATVPDIIGIGLNTIENTDNDLNISLRNQLWEATRIVSSDKSVNAIQKCLKYSHSVGNIYLIRLLTFKNKAVMSSRLVRYYTVLSAGNYDHLMSQRFAEVASNISRELGG